MGLLGYLKELDRLTTNISQNWDKIMSNARQYDDLVHRLNDATTTIGERIQRIVTQLQDGGMSAEEEDKALAELSEVGDRLVEMGKDPANPLPSPPDTTNV
jgi:uncharacterized protein YukE